MTCERCNYDYEDDGGNLTFEIEHFGIKADICKECSLELKHAFNYDYELIVDIDGG